ncbi:MAG: YigZ family protein [Bacilli bacterium]|nr:YigZ family protein [Bacilli bacterium]MDD4548070.1 YigZ family protein [Bacilli bacterium]
MLSINKNCHNEIIINKSKFITYLIKVNDEESVKQELDKLKNMYSDATHHCYAYIIGNIKRFNDDGEPSGTAGIPILSVLESNNLNNLLCVVIRYFGGIKLGAGGLVRAYLKSVTACLKEASIVKMVEGIKVIIEFNYDQTNKIDYLLKDSQIINKKFNEFTNYTFIISNEEYSKIYNELKNNTNKINEIENILIES